MASCSDRPSVALCVGETNGASQNTSNENANGVVAPVDPTQLDDFLLKSLGEPSKKERPPLEAAKPFIKWAGGKTQLLEPISTLLPARIQTYYEPFIGGGAVFWALATAKRFARAVINDWNQEIVDTYLVVRDFTDDLVPLLARLKQEYIEAPEATFMRERAKDPTTLAPLHRAARFLFLNRTGFNGMYRVNKKGQFNVPWGKYENPKILDEPLLRACSQALDRFVVIRQGDFAAAVADAQQGDVVYLDPPYVPVNATSNFTGYTSGGFGLNDQHRVALCFAELAERGVAVVASNSDTEVVREIYKGWEMRQIPARRNINSKGDRRGPVMELLIVGRRGSFSG